METVTCIIGIAAIGWLFYLDWQRQVLIEEVMKAILSEEKAD